MPWTFAHPAAVLPFRRLCPAYLSFAGLVVGSLAPDIGYYVGRFDVAAKAHTPLGVLLICLPVGFGLLTLMRLMRQPVAHILPQPHRGALLSLQQGASLLAPRALWVTVISLLLGAATHVAWDAFTHRTGYFVARSGLLQTPLYDGSGIVPVYSVLQHASTALGIVLLALAYTRFLRSTSPTLAAAPAAGREWPRYLFLGASALISVVCAAPLAYLDVGPAARESVLLVRTLIYATTAYFCFILAAALCFKLRRRREPPGLAC